MTSGSNAEETELEATGFEPGGETILDGEQAFVIVEHADTRKTFEIVEGAAMAVGRESDCAIHLADTKVSRRHFILRRTGATLTLEDLGSTNGTKVNGVRIRGARRLVGGDVLTAGRSRFTIATTSRGPAGTPHPHLEGVPEEVCVADPSMVKVFHVAQRLAHSDTMVLITGETGTGKEVLAGQIHRRSRRARGPYVRLNCAAIPEALLSSELFGHERGAFTGADRRKIGHFEAADGGTLLLDEIGELSPGMQVKLLRVLESRSVLRLGARDETPVDVRVLCATHRHLPDEVAAGRFREDLFYRVSAFTLRVPPLRERPVEVTMLAELFLRQHAAASGRVPPRISAEAVAALRAHRWPGNVRELRNALEHAYVMCDGPVIGPEHLPPTLATSVSEAAVSEPVASAPTADGPAGTGHVKDQLAALERTRIEEALTGEGGNQTRAAKALGMSRRALIYKMEKYGLKKKPGADTGRN
ncbi:MAG: sigma 54-interacting transcriptional regulator [Myxococcota bacterium]